MEKTNHFLGSLIFFSEQTNVSKHEYLNGIICERPVEVFPHVSGGNYAIFQNCQFNAHLSQNKGVIPSDCGKKHIVVDDTATYNLVAYLEIGDDNVLPNSVVVQGELLRGLEMYLVEDFPDSEVYTFSGLNLMLFNDIPNLATNMQ